MIDCECTCGDDDRFREPCPIHAREVTDDSPTDLMPRPDLPLPAPPSVPKMTDPLTDEEIYDLLTATLHGSLPKQTMMRVFATLGEVPGLRAKARGCAPGCVVGLQATPKPGTPEHDEVESYATKHGLSFEEAHVEVSAMAGRRP